MAIFKRGREIPEQRTPDMIDAQAPMSIPVDQRTMLPIGGLQGKSIMDDSRVIGEKEVREALTELKKYKDGKANLENRIIQNEKWYRLRHWDVIGRSNNKSDPQPTSAWLLNCLLNKHADAMDHYPKPTILPQEEGDVKDAETLSKIIPVIFKRNEYEQIYSDIQWYKIKHGAGITGVFWDPAKNNGLGDIDIRRIDALNLFWEPGISDIQKSRNVFHLELVDRDLLREMYPDVINSNITANAFDTAKFAYEDNVDTSDKAVVVDWYYKRRVGGRDVLHFCKFVAGLTEPLYASEDDPEYAERGFYDHGRYPFEFDELFPIEGSPFGFGYVDVCKEAQNYIDKMDQLIIKNAAAGVRPRFFVKQNGMINEEEYADYTKDFVHFTGSGDPKDHIMPIEAFPLSPTYVDIKNLKVEELKETAGNRDFQQGGTSGGVTAGNAIAALQEAGNKLSRDMNKASYRANSAVTRLVIELIRQFYTEQRTFRIIGKRGEMEFVHFSGKSIAAKPQMDAFGYDMGFRVPEFDIIVSSEKETPYGSELQNNRAKEMYQMGFFRPDMADQALAALDMMQFDQIEEVRERVAQNGTLFQQVQMLQQQMMQMAAIIDATKGSTLTQGMQGAFAMEDASKQPTQAVNARKGSLADHARANAVSSTRPR